MGNFLWRGGICDKTEGSGNGAHRSGTAERRAAHWSKSARPLQGWTRRTPALSGGVGTGTAVISSTTPCIPGWRRGEKSVTSPDDRPRLSETN